MWFENIYGPHLGFSTFGDVIKFFPKLRWYECHPFEHSITISGFLGFKVKKILYLHAFIIV